MNLKRFCAAGTVIATLLNPSLTVQGATTNRIARWLEGKSLPHLDVTQAEAYAQKHQRRPEALLAAYQVSTEQSFLREATSKYPRNPRVALAAACVSAPGQANPATDQRRRSLDVLKECAPDNALSWYLSALDHFKTGQHRIAEQEVLTGSSKPVRDYAFDLIEHAEQAYLSAGYSDAESIALAMGSLLMPHFVRLREVSAELVTRAGAYRKGGDKTSADKMLHAAIRIGTQLDRTNSLTILENMVGINIQHTALKELDPAAMFGNSGSTVQARTAQLLERRADLRILAKDFNQLFQNMSDTEIGTYFNQQKQVGEETAGRQALAK